MNYGKAIVAIREKNGMKQAELARQIGKSKTALSLIESGKAQPSGDTLQKIAEIFKIDVAFITLKAIDPQVDMSESARAKFNELFPNFQERIMDFIETEQPS